MCTKGTVKVLDQGEGDDSDGDFWGFLGDGEIQPATEDDSVEEFAPILYKLCEDPNAPPEKIAEGQKVKIGFAASSVKLDKSLLHEGDGFLIDAGWELFCWMGKAASREEKLSAMSKSDKFAKDNNKMYLPLTIVKSGFEPPAFEQYF
jgi:hypothetical protein